MANGWTQERKDKMRLQIQLWKPWEKSTGAKTPQGKATVAKNSTKDGQSVAMRQMMRELNRMMKAEEDWVY